LPEPRDFPVVVAVRLSLAVPFLLSAVPFTPSIAHSGASGGDGFAGHADEDLVFDGGAAVSDSLFDALLPTRPTFGVIWCRRFAVVNSPGLAARNANDRPSCRTPLPGDAAGVRSIIGFVATIVRTMQNWRDESQLAMPGFRDRIVIRYAPDETGLTLAFSGSSTGHWRSRSDGG
jgi:hypothetical protein